MPRRLSSHNLKPILLCLALLWQSMIGLWPMAANASPLSRIYCAQPNPDNHLSADNQAAAIRLTSLLQSLGKKNPKDLPGQADQNTDHCSDCIMGDLVDFAFVRNAGRAQRPRLQSIPQPQAFRLYYKAQGPPVGERAPPHTS